MQNSGEIVSYEGAPCSTPFWFLTPPNNAVFALKNVIIRARVDHFLDIITNKIKQLTWPDRGPWTAVDLGPNSWA